MCTSRPRCEMRAQALPDARRPASAANASRKSITPSGPSTTTSASSWRASCSSDSSRPAASAGPSSAIDRHRLERLDVPEVVADEQHPARRRAPRGPCAPRAPCACRARGPRAPAGRARGAGRARSAASPSRSSSRANVALRRRADGCGPRSRVPSPRRARPRRPRRQQVGQLLAERLQSLGRLGRGERPVARVPGLVAVLPHDGQVGLRRQPVGDVLEVTEVAPPDGRAGR